MIGFRIAPVLKTIIGSDALLGNTPSPFYSDGGLSIQSFTVPEGCDHVFSFNSEE